IPVPCAYGSSVSCPSTRASTPATLRSSPASRRRSSGAREMGARPVIAAFPRRVEANPYCELLYDHVERLGVDVLEGRSGVRWLLAHRGRVRVLHFHWPERHFDRRRAGSALGFAVRLLLARALGYRLVWTVHNLAPHDGTNAGDRLVRAVLRRTATLVVHCE